MKKLIAISVVFVLLAGAAFAADVSGQVFGKVNVVEGNSKKDTDDKAIDEIGASGGNGRIRIEASGQNDEGSFGGWARLEAGSYGGTPGATAYAWWKPLDILKLTIGNNGGDGFFAADGVTRWGFYQGAGDVGIVNQDYSFGRNWDADPFGYVGAFYGGFNMFGLVLTLTPLDALEINVAVPFSKGDAKDQFLKTHAQVAYNIDGIGKLAVTYAGGLGHRDAEDPVAGKAGTWYVKPDGTLVFIKTEDVAAPGYQQPDDFADWTAVGTGSIGGKLGEEVNDPARFHLYFGLTAIENLGIDIGLGYRLPFTTEGKDKVQYPLFAGLGVNFNGGQFGIKARVQGALAGSVDPDGDGPAEKKSDMPAIIIFDVLPSFAISDNLTAYLGAGITYTGVGKYDGKKPQDGDGNDEKGTVGWHVDPYLAYSVGPGTFYFGLNFSSSGEKNSGKPNDKGEQKPYINWAVPIGLAVSF